MGKIYKFTRNLVCALLVVLLGGCQGDLGSAALGAGIGALVAGGAAYAIVKNQETAGLNMLRDDLMYNTSNFKSKWLGKNQKQVEDAFSGGEAYGYNATLYRFKIDAQDVETIFFFDRDNKCCNLEYRFTQRQYHDGQPGPVMSRTFRRGGGNYAPQGPYVQPGYGPQYPQPMPYR